MSLRRLAAAALILCVAACSSPAQRAEQRNAAQLNTQLGINYARQGQYDLAIEKLRRAIDQDDSLAAAHSALAVVYQTRGDLSAAEKEYRRALSLDDSDAVVKTNFGVFLCGRGKVDEAQRYFKQAVRDPRYATPEQAWINAGICLKQRDHEQAEQAFREALRLRPDSVDALAQMAVLSFERKDYLRARAFLQRYDLQSRATAELLNAAARTEAALGDRNAALQYSRRLQQEFPASEEAASIANWQP